MENVTNSKDAIPALAFLIKWFTLRPNILITLIKFAIRKFIFLLKTSVKHWKKRKMD